MTSTLEDLLAEEDLDRPSTVQRLLHAVRTQLGMELAWTSEFVGSAQVFRFVDAAAGTHAPVVGTVLPLSGSFCARVLDGRLPALIPDARREPASALLDVTRDLQLGAYVGVPLLAADGTVDGMLCAASTRAVPTLTDRDLETMRLLAQLLHDLQLRELEEATLASAREQLRAQVRRVVRGEGRWPVLQPVLDVATGAVVSYEGLSRFDGDRTPAQWFDAACRVGLGPDLELAAARSVLDLARSGAVGPDVHLAVNLSPGTVVTADLDALCLGVDPARLVLEITEHAQVDDYERLREVLRPWRELGLRLAVDDLGAGYSSLQHVLMLEPDVVKIDMALVRDVDVDPVRRALVAAVLGFTAEAGMQVVAEGVETPGELAALVSLGVGFVQGFLVGRPAPPAPTGDA